MSVNQRITEIFLSAGIKDIGFCPFSVLNDRLLECRAKNRLPQNAQTVILCLFPYKVKEKPPTLISRYAAVPDYHLICGEYLEKAKEKLEKEFNNNTFEYFIDNSPIPEVYAAANAGMGVIGENGLLISEKYGSLCFIGEIVTDLCCEFVLREIRGCQSCGLCKQNCPVGLSKANCLSAVSQKKGELTPLETAALKSNKILWGCDKCSENCPQNKGGLTYIKEFISGYRDLYSDDEDITHRAYEWRGKKTIDRNYVNLKEDL